MKIKMILSYVIVSKIEVNADLKTLFFNAQVFKRKATAPSINTVSSVLLLS